MENNNQKPNYGQNQNYQKKKYHNSNQQQNKNNERQPQNEQSNSFQNTQRRKKQENKGGDYENNLSMQNNERSDNQTIMNQQEFQAQHNFQSNQTNNYQANNQIQGTQYNQNNKNNERYLQNQQNNSFQNSQRRKKQENNGGDYENNLSMQNNQRSDNQTIMNQQEFQAQLNFQSNQTNNYQANNQIQGTQYNQNNKNNERYLQNQQNNSFQNSQRRKKQENNGGNYENNLKMSNNQRIDTQTIMNQQDFQAQNSFQSKQTNNLIQGNQHNQTNKRKEKQPQNQQNNSFQNNQTRNRQENNGENHENKINMESSQRNDNQINTNQQGKEGPNSLQMNQTNNWQANNQIRGNQYNQEFQQQPNSFNQNNQEPQTQKNNNQNKQKFQYQNIQSQPNQKSNYLQNIQQNQESDQLIQADGQNDKKPYKNKQNYKKQHQDQSQKKKNNNLILNPNQLLTDSQQNESNQNQMNNLQQDQMNQQHYNNQNDQIENQKNPTYQNYQKYKNNQNQNKQKFKIEKSEFVQQFLDNHLGFKKISFNNQIYYEFERLTMFKNLDFQLRKQFNQQVKQSIKFIEEWVLGNQTLIINNKFDQQVFLKIKIFSSYVIELINKFDQSLIQNYEKLLNNQSLDDLNQLNDQLDILNRKQIQEETENQDELKEILYLQAFPQRNQNDEDSKAETMSQKTYGSTQLDESSSDAQSFISDLTYNSTNSESRKLNKEQKEEYKKFCWKLFRRFQKCLSIENAMNKRNLPAYYAREEIKNLLEVCQNPFVLLMGSTGSGKTTQTPQVLYQQQLMDEKKWNKVIYCVQPRKINCLSISERVANEMGCKLGEEVGYQVGYSIIEQKIDRQKTKIIFITESLMMNMLVKQNKQKSKQNQKNYFKHCSYIILDEVHERSVKSDIIMGLAKTIFTEQTDLKFFLSSATVDRNMYFKYFTQLPIIEIPGKIYPVDEEFIAEQGSSVIKVIKHLSVVIDRIEQGVELHNGHILVFMIDGLEIDECIKQATSLPKLDLLKYKLLPLHSRLEKDQQELVFKEHFNDDGQQMKKIIFSTNIAETAVTINNITIVIDCGMEKIAKFDPRKNITTIQQTYISKSSAKQRQGRAGRTCPGICYKLYSEEEYENFANEKVPEISRINIEQVLLQIIESGEKIETFPYFEKPDQSILKCSKDNLIRLGAIDEMSNSLTEIGRIMQMSDLEPFQIKCLIDAYKLNVVEEVTNILAVMPEIGGLFKRDEDKQKNTFYENHMVKNEYNSDFLNYHQLFCKIKHLNKNDQSKKFMKENNIKYYVWADILTNKYNLIKFRKRNETKFQMFQKISIFSGIKQLGFTDIKSSISFTIHPQSQYSRRYFDKGTILIYGNIEDREKSTFAKHISEIKIEWLGDKILFTEEIIKRVKQSIDDTQDNGYHYKIQVSNFMIDQFRKLFLTKVQEKIMEYSGISPKAKSFLILDCEQCLIKVASTKEGKNLFEQRQIGKYIEDLINQQRQIHRKKVIIRKFKESDNYAVIGEGYKIIDILLPNQFVKVKLTNLPTKNDNKGYYNLFIHKSEIFSYAQIQFLTYESARQFVQNTNLDIISNSKAISVVGVPESNIKNNLFEKFQLNVYIPTEKPTGVGYINFSNQEDRDQTLNYLKQQNYCASQFQRNDINGQKQYSIRLLNLKINQNEEYLEKQVQQTFHGFINAKIQRKKSEFFNSDQELIELQYTYLRSYATSIVLQEDIPKIYINIESEKTGFLKAKICFPKREYCEKFYQDYSKEITENGPLKINFNNVLSFFVDIKIYKLLENQYIDFKNKPGCKQVQFKETNTKDKFVIQISIQKNEQAQLLNQTFNQLKTLFKSQKLIFDIEYWQLDRVMIQQQQKIQQIQQQNKVIIQQNPKKSFLSLWFKENDSNKRKALVNKIENQIKSLFTGKKNIFLINYNQIDELIAFLEQKQKQHKFQFQRNNYKITLEGQIGHIYEIFQEVNKQFRKTTKDDISCQICFESQNLERLDQCGCLFCKDCIGEYIITSSHFDVLCCPNHDKNPITLEDSYDIINSIEEDTLIEKKVNDRINGWKNLQNLLKFIRCPTPNCDSFFGRVYKSSNGDYLDLSIPLNIRCSECYQQFCLLQTDPKIKNSKVHEYHQGKCENYKDKQFIEQMLLEEGGKYCPNCNIPIIKNEGCNHMTCKACSTHFCWICDKVFDPEIIYQHMNTCKQEKKMF
ncbi:hypothetical protein ABPG72_006584 [Tetrahymena utriculariae]